MAFLLHFCNDGLMMSPLWLTHVFLIVFLSP